MGELMLSQDQIRLLDYTDEIRMKIRDLGVGNIASLEWSCEEIMKICKNELKRRRLQ